MAVVCLETPSFAYVTFDVGSTHNFVDDGYTGGGVCSQCHGIDDGDVADSRLFKWNYTSADTDMCLSRCHGGWLGSGGTPGMPPGVEWSSVTLTPPQTPHASLNGPTRCKACHPGPDGDARDCLSCHTTNKSESD